MISGYRFFPPCSRFIRCDEIENFSCRLPPVARHAIPFTFFHPCTLLYLTPLSDITSPASTFVKNVVLLRCRKKKKEKMNPEIPRLVKSPPNLAPASFTPTLRSFRVRIGIYKLLEIVPKTSTSYSPDVSCELNYFIVTLARN